ncbi:MAG: tripartite tricarboxylate transporter substrate binding protein [Sulfuricaulis sp.]|nr:tripartite tricarboxylate transporter substrate binding protein [Sulfuricaulis sp.]
MIWQFAANSWAQNYPVKVIRYLVPDSAGGSSDTVGRIVAAGLTQVFGQQVIVENRTGAGTTIGTAIAAKAPADGYMVLQLSQSGTPSVTLYRNLSYDLVRDFAPVTRIGSLPLIVVVHPSLPVKSITELVKLAKAKPGAITYASAGVGTATFIAAELFKTVAGVDMLHVPYRGGGETITAVVSGQTPFFFAPPSTGLSHVRSGRLRPLAVTSTKRLPSLPELPTVAESGYPGFEFEVWYGLVVPAKTPKEIIGAIREATVAALKRPEVSKRMQDIDIIVARDGDPPEEFAEFIKSEIEKWGKIIRAAGLTAN